MAFSGCCTSGDGPSRLCSHSSFIDAVNFPEPKQLASYLKQLMNNETEYLSYFWWKEFYEVNSNSKYNAAFETKMNGNKRKNVMPSYCKLCQMLNDPMQPPKVWNNIDKWWSVTGGHCKPKGSFPLSKIRSLAEETLINDLIIFLLMTLAVLIIFRMQVSFRFGRLLFRFAISSICSFHHFYDMQGIFINSMGYTSFVHKVSPFSVVKIEYSNTEMGKNRG